MLQCRVSTANWTSISGRQDVLSRSDVVKLRFHKIIQRDEVQDRKPCLWFIIIADFV